MCNKQGLVIFYTIIISEFPSGIVFEQTAQTDIDWINEIVLVLALIGNVADTKLNIAKLLF
jgi:hypothetical protein